MSEAPKLPLRVKNWYVAVLPVQMAEKTKGGIEIPQEVRIAEQQVANIGRVIDIGSLAFKSKTRGGLDMSDCEQEVKVGDHVLYPHYAGMAMTVAGTKANGEESAFMVRIMKDESIIGVTSVPSAFLDIQ